MPRKEKDIERAEEEIDDEDEEEQEIEEEVKIREIKDEEDEEEEIDDEEQFSNISSFITRERIAPVLESSQETQAFEENIESIAETAPKTREEGQPTYVINAPKYAGNEETIRQDREDIRQSEMNIAPRLMEREQDILKPHHQEINFRTWQQEDQEFEEARKTLSPEEYVAKVRRKKDESKLPFQE